MKKITKILLNNFKYLFTNNGRKIIFAKIVKNYYVASALICIFPFRYRGKYIDEFNYLRKSKKLVSIPYIFSEEYKTTDIKVFWDKEASLPYVTHFEKKLYFPFEKRQKICEIYNQLLIEQDINSPHRYFTEKYTPEKTDIFVDVGCAEAMSTLEIIDVVSEAYIFEFDSIWGKPLEMTFKDYENKMHIIKKYVSDETNGCCVTIDDIFNGVSNKNIFIKIDVEGAEEKVLNGALNTFKNNNVKCLCCTYHNDYDADVLSKWFDENGFEYEFSNGVLLFVDDVDIKGELFRKALIRANNMMIVNS